MKVGSNIGKKIPTFPASKAVPGKGSISNVGRPKVKSGINKSGPKGGKKSGGRKMSY